MKNFTFSTHKLNHNPNYNNLRKIVLNQIFKEKKLFKNYAETNHYLKTISLRDLRKNNKLMIEVESLILNILNDLKFKNIKSLQYPANIRIVSNKKFSNLYSDYDTRYIHSDSWSGAPTDSFNCFIYLLVSNKSPKLELYKTLGKTSKYRNLNGKYEDIKIKKKFLKKIKFNAQEGNMAIWETHTPHRTFVKKFDEEFFRISIDFRFKLSSPYIYKKSHNLKNFHNTKMNSDGVYWLVKKNYKKHSSIKDKILNELISLKRYKFFSNLRKKYIKKYYKNINLK